MFPDPRFFVPPQPLDLAEVVRITGAVPSREGAALSVCGGAPLKSASSGHIAFFADSRYGADLSATAASAVLLSARDADRFAVVFDAPSAPLALITPTPQGAWSLLMAHLHVPRHHEAVSAIAPSARVEAGVHLAPGVVIGEDAEIGSGTIVGANTVIGPGVAIGRNCRIGSNCSIGFALIGDRVRIASGAVIGEAGFGVAGTVQGLVDVPQLGRVILQDGVSVGVNAAIDRGAFDDTVIGENTKIDNLVQVAHNVQLGRNCILAAHTGLSGSVVVGDGAMFGGRAGVVDHMTIGSGARIAAGAAVLRSVPAGETWSGYPARPLRQFLRESAWVSKQTQDRSARGEGE